MNRHNFARLTNQTEYVLLSAHLDGLIREATEGGYLSDPDENEYTHEIARLSALGGRYEAEYMTFSFSKPKKQVHNPAKVEYEFA